MAQTAQGIEMINAGVEYLRQRLPVSKILRGALAPKRHNKVTGEIEIVGRLRDAPGVLARGYTRAGVQEIFIHGEITPDQVRAIIPQAIVVHGPAVNNKPVDVSAPYDRWIDVTPEMALLWLDQCNPVNRNIHDKDVKRYARDMRGGHWRGDNPQGLIFAGDPFKDVGTARLLDGQHRLWAVSESGTTQRFHVSCNVDPAVIAVLDDGVKRNDADVYRVTHPDDVVKGRKEHTAIARQLLPQSRDLTRHDVLACMERHAEPIVWVTRLLSKGSTRMRGFRNAQTGAALVRATYHTDRETLERFIDVLASGMPIDVPRDGVVILLRNHMIGSTVRRVTTDQLYWKTERALMAFIRGENPRTLYAVDGEQFPLPEERATSAPVASKRTRK